MPRRRSCVVVERCSPGSGTLLMADCESTMITQMSWSNHYCWLGYLIHHHLMSLWMQSVKQLRMLIINISRSRICSGLELSWLIAHRRIARTERWGMSACNFFWSFSNFYSSYSNPPYVQSPPLTLGARAYGNRCLHVGNISGFVTKFFQCSNQIHFIHIWNVTSTFACDVITSNISVTFEI